MGDTRDDPPATDPQRIAERELVRRVVDGDREAARMVVARHLGPIARFAYRMIGDPAEAEDVAKETFLRLWHELPRWEARAKLGTWLHRVAHNLCVDRLRASRSVVLEAEPDQPDPTAAVPWQMDERTRMRRVALALARLPVRQRAALTLVYHQGLSNRDAALVLGLEVEALESLLARGRQALRKQLVPEKRHAREPAAVARGRERHG